MVSTRPETMFAPSAAGASAMMTFSGRYADQLGRD
jgi:hypothetical protein